MMSEGRIESALADVRELEFIAVRDTPVHRLDARAKIIVTAAFLITVVSFPKYEIAGLMPLFLYPALLLSFGQVPLRVLLRYLLIAAPFALFVGLFNPLLDRATAVHWGTWAVSGGWLSFLSILTKFVLTVSAALILLAGTGYPALCRALGRLGAPRLLVTQFLLLYRFIFVIAEEGLRMARAWVLRSRRAGGMPIRTWGSLAGHLLLRAYDRGLRVHTAMLARGFDGAMRSSRAQHWTWGDTGFILASGAFLALVRFTHPAEALGRLVMQVLR